MAQADVLVRGLLHEPLDAEELAIAGLPIVGAGRGNEMRVPQGVSPELFARASALLGDDVTSALGGRIYAHGSRAAGTARADSDLDFMIRVDRETFDRLIRERFKTPNPGSAKEATMRRAIETGKIQAGEAGLRGVRKALERELGLDVDLSVILEGGPFDRGPWIPLHEEK
jgi:hypothetical protein